MSYPNDQRYGSLMGEGELDTSESVQPLQGHVEYNRPESDGFWHKAEEALKKVGRGVKDALPYLAETAEAFGNSPSTYLPNDDSLLSTDTGLVLTNRSERAFRQPYLNADPIAKYSSKPLANNRISKLSPPLPKASPQANWSQMQARTTRILNSLASAKGLPSYEEFHQQQGVPFQNPARQSRPGVQRFNPPTDSPRGFIPEDERQIRYELAQGQKPRSLAEHMARQQADWLAQQEAAARQAALQKQQQWQRAWQNAAEQSQRNQVTPAATRQPSQDTSSLTPALVQDAFRYPRSGKSAIIQQANARRLTEDRMAQVELNLDRLHAQRRNDFMDEYLKEKREHEQNRRQMQASLRTPGLSDLMSNNSPKPLPDDYFLNPETGQLDPGRILKAGRLPSDKQLKNLFLRADVELYGTKTEFERLQAQQKLQLVKDTLATLIAGHTTGLINRDGYVVIGDQAYGQNEAIYKAMQDMAYFHEHGEHLPALKYPTVPPGNINPQRRRGVYPDVTQNYQKFLNKIVQETKAVLKSGGKIVFDGGKPDFKKGVYGLFARNFPNNGKWDTQVGHGFPGQVVLRDPKTGEALPHHDSGKYPDRVETIDQYAIFKGKPVRAGYLSNYAYGYAAAAGRLHLNDNGNILINPLLNEVGNTVAYGNIKSGQLVDNPEDTQAIKEGYEAYWREHPHEKRTWHRFEGYHFQ